MVAKRQHAIADDLPGLVTLAGDQEHIALLEPRNGLADRFRAVADFLGALGGGEDRCADGRRIFAARIVVGDDDLVGSPPAPNTTMSFPGA